MKLVNLDVELPKLKKLAEDKFHAGEFEKCEGILEAVKYLDNADVIKCSECSRRKFYQQGYEDGLKAHKLSDQNCIKEPFH